MLDKIMTKEQYDCSVANVKKWSDSYYNDAVSLVTDAEFDEVVDALQEAEREHPEWVSSVSPSQCVGAVPDSRSSTSLHGHWTPMLSLNKVRDHKGLVRFISQCTRNAVKNDEFYVDYKLDGLACSIKYVDGELEYAATRGTGLVGLDVTDAARCISNLPQRIHRTGTVFVRGEVVVYKSVFAQINEKSETKFSNPRNFAAGCLLRKAKVNEDGSHPANALMFYAWELVPVEGNPLTHVEQVAQLNEMGFSQPHGKLCHGIKEITDFINETAATRDSLPYEIDGMVIKANSPEIRKAMGVDKHAVRWAVAWKFASKGAVTHVRDILWNVGRTGKLTPVVVIDPITIDGVRINRVNGHNASLVKQWNVGAKVVVVRSGDVIPRIQEVVTSAGEYILPKHCPCCGEPLNFTLGDLSCINPDCKGKFKAWLKYIIHRDVLDITGLGESFVDEAVDSGTITRLEDIFVHIENKSTLLKDSDLAMLVERMRQINIMELLMILNIPSVGKAVASKLAMIFRTTSELVRHLVNPTLIRHLTVSSTVQDCLIVWCINPRNHELLNNILKLGLPKLK